MAKKSVSVTELAHPSAKATNLPKKSSPRVASVASTKKKSTVAAPASAVAKKPTTSPSAKAMAAKREREDEKLWMAVTNVVVPTYFGVDDADVGMKRAKTLPPEALLALVAIGNGGGDSERFGSSQTGMEMMLRPSGFDRTEANDIAYAGFKKLVKEGYARLGLDDLGTLTVEGQAKYDLLRKCVLGS